MFAEFVPSLEEIIVGRLDELVDAGHITQSVRDVAEMGNVIALGIMVGYLDTCLEMPSHRPVCC